MYLEYTDNILKIWPVSLKICKPCPSTRGGNTCKRIAKITLMSFRIVFPKPPNQF